VKRPPEILEARFRLALILASSVLAVASIRITVLATSLYRAGCTMVPDAGVRYVVPAEKAVRSYAEVRLSPLSKGPGGALAHPSSGRPGRCS
jgi:hypothetical protein